MDVVAGPAVTIPRLRTSRLLLRELRVDDFESYAIHMADPVAMKHMGKCVDRRTSWRIFGALSGSWMFMNAGWWAIEVIATRDFVGMVGAFFRETSLPITKDSDLELGWSVFQPFWRRGYASEAAKAALDYGFQNHTVKRAIANIDPANAASIGVSKAIGMTYDGEHDFYGEPSTRYALNRTPT